MTLTFGRLVASLWLALAVLVGGNALAAEMPTIKVGVLKFGTVNWELDVIKHHGLDRAAGIELQMVELANKQATTVALLSGSVDMIVTDWMWVVRERAEGRPFTFVPYSGSVGALMVPDGSPIKSLADLKGKRLGIAGGPVDKGWLLMRALAEKRHGLDLDQAVEKVFAAPPLLSQQIEAGELDAVITFWHFAARLQAKGMTRLVDVGQVAAELGVAADMPTIGYVFRDDWGHANAPAVAAFVKASADAKELLRTSDGEWQRLRPQTRAEDPATEQALRDGYVAGIPGAIGAAERQAAADLFVILRRLGGENLVGKASLVDPGTFWEVDAKR